MHTWNLIRKRRFTSKLDQNLAIAKAIFLLFRKLSMDLRVVDFVGTNALLTYYVPWDSFHRMQKETSGCAIKAITMSILPYMLMT